MNDLRRELLTSFSDAERCRLEYLRWLYEEGMPLEFDEKDFPLGQVVRIVSRSSQYHMHIGEIIEVCGQAGQYPITIKVRIGGEHKLVNCEVHETRPIEEEELGIQESGC